MQHVITTGDVVHVGVWVLGIVVILSVLIGLLSAIGGAFKD